MPRASDARFLVLHGLRLKGFGEADGIAEVVGLDTATVDEHLAKLAVEDLALRRDGKLAGWTLTAAGRAEQERLAAEDAALAGATDAVRACYERFLTLNVPLLEACTDWQVRNGAPNDHADAAYDDAVLARLHEIHDGVLPILDDLTGALPRYGTYAPRLSAAIAKVDAGERDWFTKPLVPSYHTVWFELHEDLLTTLGLDRSQEGGS